MVICKRCWQGGDFCSQHFTVLLWESSWRYWIFQVFWLCQPDGDCWAVPRFDVSKPLVQNSRWLTLIWRLECNKLWPQIYRVVGTLVLWYKKNIKKTFGSLANFWLNLWSGRSWANQCHPEVGRKKWTTSSWNPKWPLFWRGRGLT